MSNMTAAEIRKALKPMADFAPAIMSALRIIESAEAAELALPQLSKETDRIIATNKELERQRNQYQSAMSEAKTKLNGVLAASDAAIADKKKELSEVKSQVEKAKGVFAELEKQCQACHAEIEDGSKSLIAELEKQRQARSAEIDKEIAVETERLDAIKAEISRLKKSVLAA